MVRDIVVWKCAVLYLVTLNVLAKSIPIDIQSTNSIITTESAFTNANEVTVKTPEEMLEENVQATLVERSNFTKSFNITRNTLLRDIRPGQQVRQYVVSITFDDNRFHGRAVIDVVVTAATRGDNLLFHFDNVAINSVQTGVFTIASAVNADYDLDDGILEIEPVQDATSYIVIVEYTGVLSNTGRGLYIGEGHGLSYIGMNLYPTNARRVFPCMDDPTEAATVSFTFTDVGYTNIITNSIRDDSNTVSGENQFRTLIGPVHTWGMIAHNFINLNIPTTNVLLVGRSGVSNQDSQSSLAINAYFAYFNDWTDMEFFDIVMNQETRLHFLALPDVDREWNTLSTIGIWEPHILMENVASVKQRKTVLVKVAEALARQWFGYVIHPQNWRHEWVVSGFATYSAYEAVRSFQSSATGSDVTLLDMNTLFITDVIQESLLQDSYASTPPLLVAEDLLDEEAIRDYIFSVQRSKAPALMHMMRMILGSNDHDPIQVAAQALLTGRALETVNSQNFIDAMSSGLLVTGSNFIDDFEEYLEPWIENNGYPILHVGLRQGGVLVTQERFGFSARPHINFPIPITYTTSINPDFSDNNIRPVVVTDATVAFNMFLDEEDWVLFNIQGQGYYRVNYDGELWERIIEALEDEVLREVIHPLNRATLVDDALNLARAGKLDYDIAFRVVLSMEHETEYPVWKAFVRNMDFLRKRLVALVTDDDDDDFDPDIYLRMVRRTIVTLEDELGFYPDPLVTEPAMVSLTRGLVMDHACRANYIPCIAAAKDWFYDPNSNNDVVNPNIPYEIRPAVYCTMVREGDENVIEALENRLELEASHYERVVILEALACSQDDNYISQLLMETITGDKYLTEERVKIFKAVAESSYHNAELAVSFISRRAAEMRDWYGGDEKLEEVIFHLADNMADADLSTDFEIFVNSQNNNLDDSQLLADRALLLVQENRLWDDNLMEYVYEWIDENDAPTLAVSLALVSITFMITLFNH